MGANGGGSRSASREFGTEISRPDGRFWRVIPGPRQLLGAIFWGLGPADRGQLCPAPPTPVDVRRSPVTVLGAAAMPPPASLCC